MSGQATAQSAKKAGGTTNTRFPPEIIIAAGCLMSVITFGPRSAVGQFQLPILGEFNFGSEVFSFAMAVQYLFWGLGQPIAGAIADKYGTARVLVFGCLVYALGIALVAWSSDPLTFTLTQGVIVGLGFSSCSFGLIIGAFGKLLPPERRSFAFGVGTAAGSFGQFLFSPLSGAMIQAYGWQMTAFIFAATVIACIPLAIFLTNRPSSATTTDPSPAPSQSFRQAIKEAFGHRSYVLLVTGFFTCGFQLAFVTVHFQRYVVEAGLAPSVGYWAFALVGIFNIIGSLASGWLGDKVPRNWVLSFIYLSRSLVTIIFIMLPVTPLSTMMFGVLSGLLWLSTVPPTSSLIGIMFGMKYFSTLYGLAFLNHQLGGFIGLMLAGWLREATGSYTIVWWLSIALGIISAVINIPIVEKPVSRQPATAAA
ncbi:MULTISPECIES: MFS transporter [unclassified Beijerinckia]|uniref:MFS transporter n=1 Tax=unclassified Beijerinckia TaxID=2638183 RepID=UPI00089B55FE|nr:MULTISPECIES: MFS transporter [unclassified Beijerinckia]MDH7796595.1 MFS family permease [Beijerinckia sp. GAS462]SEC51794.1 Predicted arabinose efflux permease, MFS family [Beijerinckia sp. 28-YEA-48]